MNIYITATTINIDLCTQTMAHLHDGSTTFAQIHSVNAFDVKMSTLAIKSVERQRTRRCSKSRAQQTGRQEQLAVLETSN